MINAKVYSPESLDSQMKDTISDGLDIIGPFVGGVSVQQFGVLKKVPVDSSGAVNIHRLRLGGLDRYTELHIFAVPISEEDYPNVYGLGAYNTGVSFINTAAVAVNTPTRRAITVAHEAAHSLGYVLEDSPQRIDDGGAHCVDTRCIMEPGGVPLSPAKLMEMFETENVLDIEGYLPKKPDTFCPPCTADMSRTMDQQLAKLRHARVHKGVWSPVGSSPKPVG